MYIVRFAGAGNDRTAYGFRFFVLSSIYVTIYGCYLFIHAHDTVLTRVGRNSIVDIYYTKYGGAGSKKPAIYAPQSTQLFIGENGKN